MKMMILFKYLLRFGTSQRCILTLVFCFTVFQSAFALDRIIFPWRAASHIVMQGEEFELFWKRLRKFPFTPIIGDGNALKNPVHVKDLVDGLVSIAGNDKTYSKVYNLCGSEEISMKDLAKLMLSYKGGARPAIHIPGPCCRVAANILGNISTRPPISHSAISGVIQNANLDNSSARTDLGYNPIGVSEGFNRCFGKNKYTKEI